MTGRSRASARQAGTRFETSIAQHLAAHIDDRIERRARTGSKDRGDIASLRTAHGHRVVVECKDVVGLSLGSAHNEAEVERGNDDALVAVVAHKRRGRADPGQQWITCTVDDLIALIAGTRP